MHLKFFRQKMNEKQLRAELDAVYNSISWKITAPLRIVSAFLRRYVFKMLSPKRWCIAFFRFLLRQSRFVIFVKRALVRLPQLRASLQKISQRLIYADTKIYTPAEIILEKTAEKSSLSPSSTLIFRELQRAIQHKS